MTKFPIVGQNRISEALFNSIKGDAVRVFKRTSRRTFSVGLVLVLAGVATSAGLSIGASPAYAYGNLSVDYISASNISVSSYGCRYIPVQASISGDGFTTFYSARTDILVNGNYNDYFYLDNGSSSFQWCPRFNGYGRFTLGPTVLSGYYDNGGYNFGDYGSFDGTDYTSSSFYIKRKSLLSFSGSQSSSSRVSWTIRAKRFEPNGYLGYVRWNPPKVQLQRWNGSAWVKIRNFYPAGTGTSRGVVKYSMKTGKGLKYRVVSNANGTTWGRTSEVVRTRR